MTTNKVPAIALRDGRAMPQLGFGVWQIPNETVSGLVQEAIRVGYRSIDTAAIYGNEEGVGDAIRACGLPREQLFITTKLWNDRHDDAERALAESLKRLCLDYVDLYLVHWPAPKQNRYVDAWKALAKLQQQGQIRSIGVSNFTEAYLQRLIDETGIVPVLNQIELHPVFQQQPLRVFHRQHQIVTESWSPLGKDQVLDHPVITALAKRYGKTAAQIVLRWHLDSGLITIPKSATPSRIRENFTVFDFTLTPDDMAAIQKIDSGRRLSFDPEHFS
ncbi:MAG: aldo/keto reductase [Burkholderiales bacterium]|jgi:2,5-diketo-D-gluconate reductase A|nr:aldo/keto reductase [Burkholderiales bacterium]